MDQHYNPFEDALKETGAAPNPFPVADFFGNAKLHVFCHILLT